MYTGLFRNIGASMLWMLLLGMSGSNTLHHRDKWVVVKTRVYFTGLFIRVPYYIWDLKKDLTHRLQSTSFLWFIFRIL